MKLPPVDRGGETIGERIARMRKERGFTQVELADKIGTIQTIVSDYETDRLRLSAEMAVRFALALDVSMDDILNPKGSAKSLRKSQAARSSAAWNGSRSCRRAVRLSC